MRSTQMLRLVIVGLILSSVFPLLAAEQAPRVQTSSWSCPWYSQICSTDSQCDAYCGGVGWGECISLGGARKCCACNT